MLAHGGNRREVANFGPPVESDLLTERAGLPQGPGWGFGGAAQIREDLNQEHNLFDVREEGHAPTIRGTGSFVDRKVSFEQLAGT